MSRAGAIIFALLVTAGLSGCAVPAWVTAASVTAVAGAGTAALTLDTEALKVWDDQHPVPPTPATHP